MDFLTKLNFFMTIDRFNFKSKPTRLSRNYFYLFITMMGDYFCCFIGGSFRVSLLVDMGGPEDLGT